MTIKVDFKVVSIILLVVIASMIAIWQPWDSLNSRTITINGEATVTATPDQFVFNPSYQATTDTSQEAISKVSKTGNATVNKLKELGVADNKIETRVDTSGSTKPYPMPELPRINNGSGSFTASFTITATVSDKNLAQQVLDYLVTTPTVYGVTPSYSLSNTKKKELENQARGIALKDAKDKANQTVAELGVKLGRVVSMTEPNWQNGGIIVGPVPAMENRDSLTVPILQTGEEEVTMSVTVVFRLR